IPPTPTSESATQNSSRTPNSASTFMPTTSCRMRASRRQPCCNRSLSAPRLPPSFHQTGLLGHLAYPLELRADLGRRLLGCCVARQDAERGQSCRDGGCFDRLFDRADEGFPRVLRDPCRREKAEPDAE